MDNNSRCNFDKNGNRIGGYPISQKEWWSLVDYHWENLTNIIFDQMEYSHPAYDIPGDDTSGLTGNTIAKEIEFLKESRDARIARYFHAAWGLASDCYAYSVPSWGVLCDLCSEDQNVFCDGPDEEVPITVFDKCSVEIKEDF